ncbi:hypothetical protein, variant 3 [Aphanomyces astaci]|uniref:Uncharacterized protein n=2 Tax=Aphanomyces astaci TaxID=112090 RepID=W4G3M7_APHAT|nr:hypothetical protein, variant 2 [Aphanomyces astaci]XP_009835976.1 hypothetical protein, variant 3 [Aphanomyces astaci]ETV74312.1 hypothetical protein, variant 2 [Aphanomyces astaci]ETV74313.1 hypothetical protein, variant 3 [Aphanomyces astaci]|eukprot:XP_009835975.1 hypothetical protein, variant 2 [Aphanomyces astaci]
MESFPMGLLLGGVERTADSSRGTASSYPIDLLSRKPALPKAIIYLDMGCQQRHCPNTPMDGFENICRIDDVVTCRTVGMVVVAVLVMAIVVMAVMAFNVLGLLRAVPCIVDPLNEFEEIGRSQLEGASSKPHPQATKSLVKCAQKSFQSQRTFLTFWPCRCPKWYVKNAIQIVLFHHAVRLPKMRGRVPLMQLFDVLQHLSSKAISMGKNVLDGFFNLGLLRL